MDSCAVCGATGELKRCGKCKVVKYCSKEHQVQHWKSHKTTCGKDITQPCAPTGRETGAEASSHPGLGAAGAADPENDEAVPFHEGPVSLTEFPKPESNELKDILDFCYDCLKSDGFVVLDDVLNPEECTKLEEEVKHLDESGRMQPGQLAGGKTSGSKEEMVVNQSIRSDNIVWLDGVEPEYPQVNKLMIDKMDGYIIPLTALFSGGITISGRTKAMVTCYPSDGTNYHRHVDNPSGDGRIITCLFYINRDWDAKTMGGVLRIFPSSMPGKYVDIAPILNRMVIFWSDRRTPHEVHPTFNKRYTITMWYFDAEQRAKAQEKQMQKELEKIESDIVMLNIKTKKVEKETMEKKIETTATSAVNMLSSEELDALAKLVDTAPDPRAFLTSIGIAHVLQDKVLQTIADRKA